MYFSISSFVVEKVQNQFAQELLFLFGCGNRLPFRAHWIVTITILLSLQPGWRLIKVVEDPIYFWHRAVNPETVKTKAEDALNMGVDRILKDIKTVVRDGEELLQTGMSRAKERAVAGARTTDRLLRDHFYQTVGIVFGLGLVAGVIATSRLIRSSRRGG
jgi:ElaB/YqjD/DUF883 family membrane-anchored ribosome-binding protein